MWDESVPEKELQGLSRAIGETVDAQAARSIKRRRSSNSREEGVDIVLGKTVPHSLQTHMD